MASSAACRSGTSISARNPSLPTLTPRTGARLPTARRIARSMVPSPPRLTSRSADAVISSAWTGTASQPIRVTSGSRPSTFAPRARLQVTTASTVSAGVRSGWSTRPTALIIPIRSTSCRSAGVSLQVTHNRQPRTRRHPRTQCPRCAALGKLAADRCERPWTSRRDGLAQRQLERASARLPGRPQVFRIRRAVLVDADLVEVGEVLVVPAHDVVEGDDAGLVREHLDVRGPPLALVLHFQRLAGAQVLAPAERRADDQRALVLRVGDRNRVVPA